LISIESHVGHTVLASAVPKGICVVFDCGANRGDFSTWAASEFDGTVYAFEADPEIASGFTAGEDVKVFNVAVAGHDGNVILRRARRHCSSTVFNREAIDNDTLAVPARTLESICQEYHISRVNLLKLDIEGAELEVLENASPSFLASVDQITCEFHDFLDSSHRPRIRAVLSRMKRAGFFVRSMSFWTYGDVLMLNKGVIDCGLSLRFRLLAHKYSVGVRRVLRRCLRRS